MSNIVVYTAITNDKDTLKIDQEWGDADWICFTDGTARSRDDSGIGNWTFREAYSEFKCPNRNAKIHKILSHLYFGEYKYSVWIDGSMTLKVPPKDLVREWIGVADLALYRHPERKSIYEEGKLLWSVPRHRMDNPLINEQLEYYKKDRVGGGLFDCSVLVRRHNKRAVLFNEIWWAQVCRWTRRDQLSVVYAMEKSKILVNTIEDPPRKFKSRETNVFRFTLHKDTVKRAKKQGIPILKRMK